MAHYQHDGHWFDLTCTYVDTAGVEWRWTGKWTDGAPPEPLMQSTYHGKFDADSAVPLPTVYRDHGPLIKVLAPVSAAALRAALLGPSSGYVATTAAGFTETFAAFEARIIPRGTRNA
ncbi:phiSA1p31-related protein [Streptomyces candidus]|uniref:Uncharacterized protein n=1 Tax=Streptomyces candidus TaxID=67283 RepID=A0A7X0HLH1_9ACTN|nr:phiSA1p31-related protein [Streptomyces candidus]MBB6439892.1 hypothetical protein [Streptomyces candidus]GHH58083.1 hypothetical protein GCM10018773_66090 [Streptomyces candidus]